MDWLTAAVGKSCNIGRLNNAEVYYFWPVFKNGLFYHEKTKMKTNAFGKNQIFKHLQPHTLLPISIVSSVLFTLLIIQHGIPIITSSTGLFFWWNMFSFEIAEIFCQHSDYF